MKEKEKALKELTDWVFTTQESQVVTTSLKVAEVFGKEHRNVLKDIRTLISKLDENEGCSNFSNAFCKISYKTKINQYFDAYEITRDGFVLLTMGYTTKNALKFKCKYIQKFNEMLKQLERQRIKKIEIKFEKLLQAQEDKVGFFDTVVGKDEYHTLEECSKLLYNELRMGRNNLFATLRRKRILDKDNLPYQCYIKDKYFTVSKDKKGHNVLLVTNKGLAYIYNVVKNDLATVDQDGTGLQLTLKFE